MNYTTGERIQVGDMVFLDNSFGKILVLIEENCSVAGYVASEWAYLETGLLVETEKSGLLHINKPDEDLVFVGRASNAL